MDTTKLILAGAAAAGAAGLLLTVFADPTAGDLRRLDGVATTAKSAVRLTVPAQAALMAPDMAQRPIFAMTTGNGALAEKTLQLVGIAISPGRKAALVSVDGAAPVWFVAGQPGGDVRLIDVDGRRARLDTPLGERMVGLNDAPPTPAVGAGG
ncbi:hypothetical protein ABI_12970 [Asticcacaulis biprosthecium C19]|uniref:Uncharacterized protein n=1 Tax=Asticcacaulis biprosthecium C19 TaxID=715226 RepID=F4QHZ2_9CAUL|nr:hypothetical protein [Asticcacaulis biprosthecium]EGF92859.1 hypothetical protein ABI_12970 [Asticcacaulis biprosthecium C19]